MTKRLLDEVEVWEHWYKPIVNNVADFNNEESILFETFGAEYERVLQCPVKNVWTWVDGSDGTYILSGLHFVNRIGYFITEEEWQSPMVIAFDKY